jgi:hypothetical protein
MEDTEKIVNGTSIVSQGIWHLIFQQGLPLILLAVAVLWFNHRDQELTNEINMCDTSQVNILKSQLVRDLAFAKVIQENTDVIKQNSESLDNYHQILESYLKQ